MVDELRAQQREEQLYKRFASIIDLVMVDGKALLNDQGGDKFVPAQ